MQIADFIKTALVDIATGIKEANEAVEQLGVRYAPIHTIRRDNKPEILQYDDAEISFDLAVTASQDESSGGKFGISVLDCFSFNSDTGGASNHMNTVSRVSFSIRASFNAQVF